MAPRANWKGHLKVEQIVCPVALYSATSTSERISFHLVNRKTGNRLHREFVDSDTGEVVPREDQVKGYEVSQGNYVSFHPDEIAAALPESDKTVNVTGFIECGSIDDIYLDRPYYLAPVHADDESFGLIREGMAALDVAAIADAMLFRRVRKLLIRSYYHGLIATTLSFDYEVRRAAEAFHGLGEFEFDGEMLELARHIIDTKMGSFDPREFDDRYDAALAELTRAKVEGRPIERPAPRKKAEVIDLKEALRKSAALTGKSARVNRPARGRREAG